MRMLPHQEAAFERLKALPHCGLMWTMGRGKTKTAIDIAVYKYNRNIVDRVLIVAPNYVHSQWVTEQLPLHCYVLYRSFVYKTATAKAYKQQLDDFLASKERKLAFLAMHYDAFSTEKGLAVAERFCVKDRTLFILDEASRIKSPKSKRTKALTSLHRSVGGPSMILTGTALAKRPSDIWAMCNFMDKAIIPCTYTAFEQAHTVLQTSQYRINGKQVTVKQPITVKQWDFVKARFEKLLQGRTPTVDDFAAIAKMCKVSENDARHIYENQHFCRYKNIDKMKAALSSTLSFIDAKDDIQLPDKIYKTLTFPLEREQEDLLRQLKKYAVAQYKDTVLSVKDKAAVLMKALQICGGFVIPLDKSAPVMLECKNAKLEWLLQALPEFGDSQILVFAVFVEELKLLENVLSKELTTAAIYGSTKKADRETIVEDFKAGKIQCLVCNPTVAGYGLNLQNADYQVWYSRSYMTEARIQSEGRTHRIGTKRSPVYIDLVYDCAFERNVLASNKEGRDMNDFFTRSTVEEILSV